MMIKKTPIVTMVSPLHDPEARLAEKLTLFGKDLLALYNNSVAVSVTSKTSSKTIKLLKKLGISYHVLTKKPSGGVAHDIKNAIKLGLLLNTPNIHFIDFDRALHWVERFPLELASVIGKISQNSGYTSMVRTKKAFESHPLTQRVTEITINAIAGELTKIDVDIMSGSFAVDHKLGNIIISKAKRLDFGIYAEILTIALKSNFPINTLEVDGLEWETPDQFQEKIEKEGYADWIAKFQSLDEWEKRVKLVEDSTEVLVAK